MYLFNPLTRDPGKLLLEAVQVLQVLPCGFMQRLHAQLLTRKFKILMPTSPVSLSISDPLSAMVTAALVFLSSPGGQQFLSDLRVVAMDLINHVHAQLPSQAVPVKAS
jgi:hypothetical protein